jgi:23S rRNA pseudouridine2605 synthase
MTDSNDDDKKGRPRGRPDRGRTSGDRPFRKPREGGERPYRSRGDDKDRPPRPRGEGGDKPFRTRRDEGDGPRRPRPRAEGDRPYRSRADDRPRKFERSPERDRPPHKERLRREGDRPYRDRTDERPRKFERSPERDRPPREELPQPVARVEEPAEERIAKVIARAGIASRRDAEAMIGEGRVPLNGEVLASPAINVTAQDKITVDGEPLPEKERTRLWIFHKPRGLVTTARDPEGRPTVFDSLPEELPRVVAVGRLDINTEGLLLFTNDGGLARVIAHPETGWLRRYKVRAHGEITQADLDRLGDGTTVDEMEYGPIEARLDRVQGDNVWITMGLREGKNREVKRILEHLGLSVNRLIRLSFGPFQLGDLKPGLVEEVRTRVLKDQLGAKLAEEAGVDFESPVREPIAPFGSPKERDRQNQDRQERRERERPDRRERPAHRDRDERPRRHDRERPFRNRDEEVPRRPARHEPTPKVWRAGEDEEAPRRKVPRRGADARAERTASGARPHERIGAIKSREGRRVVVERLVSEPQEERARPARKPRSASRPAPRGDDRPRRPRPEGDRPFRGRDEDGPARGRDGGERPARGKPPGGGYRSGPKGGPKSGPGKGPRGGAKGGPKGPPRGRRP